MCLIIIIIIAKDTSYSCFISINNILFGFDAHRNEECEGITSVFNLAESGRNTLLIYFFKSDTMFSYINYSLNSKNSGVSQSMF